MSDRLRAPFDDDALDGYWDALVRGQQPSAQLSPDVAQTLRRLTSLDPAPQSSTVRERAWAETWKRIQSTPPEQEHSTMHAMQISSNHRQPPSMPVSGNTRAAPSPDRFDRRWAVVAALIAATLIAFAAFGYFDPFGSDPDNGPVIPAAVVQEASPTATAYPMTDHPIIGAWLMEMEPWDPGRNIHYVIFDADGTFTGYEDFSGVYIGTWRATGERTVELVFVVQHPITLGTFEPAFDVPTSMFKKGNPVTSWMSFEVDESGNSFTAFGYYEPRRASGDVMIQLEYGDEYSGEPKVTGARLAPVQQSAATPTA